MLSFKRKRLVIALVFFCCAIFALAKFGSGSQAASWSEILVPSIAVDNTSIIDRGLSRRFEL